MRKKNIILALTVAISFLSCEKNKFKDVDLSGVHTDFAFYDFDSDLFAISPNLNEGVVSLKAKYPVILPLFTTEVIRIAYPEDEGFAELLASFINDTTMQEVKELVDERIDKKELAEDLDDAFTHFKYYFPNKTIPQVFTCVSGFNQSIVMTDSLLGIGVDKYLGRDCIYYPQLGISNYQVVNMYPQKMLSDVIYAWSTVQFPFKEYGPLLIDKMIYEGKLQYILDATLPDLADSIKIGYTAQQLEFCELSEESMWRYLAEQKMLFSSDRMDIIRYTGEAPYTSSFTTESPGRTACWLGWQIVKSYMENNPTVSLSQLMAETDCKKILNESAYHPK